MLTVEQHRTELHMSTYTWIFFNGKYYGTVWSGLAGTMDADPGYEATQIQKNQEARAG